MARILIVEDNEMNRDMLSRRLERRGYQIAIAIDGGEAVRMTTAEPPDLVLMDMSLPVLTGAEATQAIRRVASLRRLPILALTASAMTGDKEAALAAGCDDYDTKPVDLARLIGKIEALLARGG